MFKMLPINSRIPLIRYLYALLFVMQDGTSETQDLMQFLSDTDYLCLGNRPGGGGGWAVGYFLGGYVPPRTPNWHPVLKQNSPKIDTPF